MEFFQINYSQEQMLFIYYGQHRKTATIEFSDHLGERISWMDVGKRVLQGGNVADANASKYIADIASLMSG